MIIDITSLNRENILSIDTDINIEEDSYVNTDIIEIKKMHFKGFITKSEGDYYIDGNLNGIIVLPDSLTFEPTNCNIDTEISGNIAQLLEEIGIFDKKIENTIDIFPIIWENILMEIPIRVENKESRNGKIEGKNWRVIEDNEESSLNPELQKLKDLFK